VIVVCGQTVPLGRIHAGRTMTLHVSEHTLAIELDGETERPPHQQPARRRQGQPAAPTQATSTELSASDDHARWIDR
jgi:hypothetical protein